MSASAVPERMSPERFERTIAHRLADDPDLVRLLARLGARLDFEDPEAHDGEGHHAPLALVARPVKLHVRLEPTGAPGYLQAARFALAAPDGPSAASAWLPILDVPPEQSNRWVTSRPFGAWSRDEGRLLAYQGWWQHSPGVGKADISTRVIAHARHRHGRLLWLGSRTNVETPGDLHKHVMVALVDDDR
ncbi:MAG: hypothetical protein EHM87_01795 [Burkholderiales bacterium]|nr:MAG: hypothetical protein EHM87_01795 [Burkholderiales bacterium]